MWHARASSCCFIMTNFPLASLSLFEYWGCRLSIVPCYLTWQARQSIWRGHKCKKWREKVLSKEKLMHFLPVWVCYQRVLNECKYRDFTASLGHFCWHGVNQNLQRVWKFLGLHHHSVPSTDFKGKFGAAQGLENKISHWWWENRLSSVSQQRSVMQPCTLRDPPSFPHADSCHLPIHRHLIGTWNEINNETEKRVSALSANTRLYLPTAVRQQAAGVRRACQ